MEINLYTTTWSDGFNSGRVVISFMLHMSKGKHFVAQTLNCSSS